MLGNWRSSILRGNSTDAAKAFLSFCPRMKKKLKWVCGAFVIAFVLLQLTNPARINPPITAARDFLSSNSPPPKITAMLRAACYDCHSSETKWPWYSR
ncbi:MAG: heme-binding domain-containing protein, partial [Limisphaerales bacterium]